MIWSMNSMPNVKSQIDFTVVVSFFFRSRKVRDSFQILKMPDGLKGVKS